MTLPNFATPSLLPESKTNIPKPLLATITLNGKMDSELGSSVVEPFHCGPAPAPAIQDAGSGSNSGSTI